MLCQISFGQTGFKNSKVYLKNDSIIQGDVNFLDSNPNEVKVSNMDLINISLIDSIENEFYKFKNFEINGSEKILMVIVEGISMNLYKEIDNKVYFVKKNEKLYELEAGKVLIENETGRYNKTITKYRGILKYLSDGRPELQRETDKLKYTEKDLTSFVIRYNSRIDYLKSDNKLKGRYFSDKQLFFQYSLIKNNLYYRPNLNITPSFYELGIRAYIKEGSRSSISTSLQYGKNTWVQGHYVEVMQLNVNYIHDFYQAANADIYLNVRLIDATYLRDNRYGNSIDVWPRINLSFGYRYHIANKVNLFIELNQLLNVNKIPSNFSFGFSYKV